jgi:hypothetical protein
MDTLKHLDEADDRWTAAEETAAALKAELFEACAQAVRDGHTPDEIAAHMRSRKTPAQIKAGFTFSAAYIRRKVREIGVAALRGGPKRKASTDAPAGE